MSTATVPTTQPTQLTIRQRLESDEFKDSIAKVLPKHVKPDRMVRVAITALTRTPKLRDCDQASFFLAMLNLSQWGLEPDGRRAHLIPFENRKRGVCEVQLIIDYKGLVELVMRSGDVSNIHADVVCDNDDFIYDRGELKRHKIDFKNPRGNVYAAYCLVRMKDGTEKCEVMNRDEIEGIRKRSKAGNSGPWVSDWNEMAKKTVFRRVSKWLPLSAEVQEAMTADDDVLDTIATPTRSTPTLDDLAERLIGRDEPIELTPENSEEVTDPSETTNSSTEPPAQFTSPNLDKLAIDLQSVDSISDVNALRSKFIADDPEEDAVKNELCDAAVERIKGSRGANSNGKGGK